MTTALQYSVIFLQLIEVKIWGKNPKELENKDDGSKLILQNAANFYLDF